MFQAADITDPGAPVLSWGVLSRLTLAKFSVTLSVIRSPPPAPPVETFETIRSCILIFRYSTADLPPALRTVSSADLKCVPLQQALIRLVVVVSMFFMNDRSCTFTLPAPPPVAEWVVPDCDMPQLHERTWISLGCESSMLSPLRSSIFKNISIAMAGLLLCAFERHPNQLLQPAPVSIVVVPN